MKIIDFHTHVFPEKLAAHALAQLCQPGRHEPLYDGTLSGLLAAMDRAGISRAVTAPVATKASQVATINEFAASQPRDRITPFGGIHPDTPNPRAVLAEFRQMGLIGFKMHPDYQEFRPDEERMRPIWEAAVEFDLIALMHSGRDVGPQTVHGRPATFVPVIEAYPQLTLVLAHFGGFDCWDEVQEHIAGRDVYLDTSYTFGDISRDQFLEIAKAHGTHRLLFGSDGPWADPLRDIAFLESSGLSDEQLSAIYHENAERILAR